MSVIMDSDLLVVIIMTGMFILNVPLYLYLGKRFFGNWAGFKEALNFCLTPGYISATKGEFHDNKWAGLKMAAYFAICACILAFEYLCVFLLIKI
jgi:hypothetical protein